MSVEHLIKSQEITLIRVVISINIPKYFNLVYSLIKIVFIVDNHFETNLLISLHIDTFKSLSKNSIS